MSILELHIIIWFIFGFGKDAMLIVILATKRIPFSCVLIKQPKVYNLFFEKKDQ